MKKPDIVNNLQEVTNFLPKKAIPLALISVLTLNTPVAAKKMGYYIS